MDIKYAGKVTIPHLIELIKTFFIKKEDIVDNLTSTDTTAPLSANQGHVLNERIDTTNELLNSKAEEIIVVTIDDNGESSSSSSEIYGHISKGGSVVLDHTLYGRLYIQSVAETGALFVGYLPLKLNNEIISAAIYIQGNSVFDLTESVKPINSPGNAQNSQALIVETVDEDGVPTSWKTANIPELDETYILQENETLDDVPSYVNVVFDSNEETFGVDVGQFATREFIIDIFEKLKTLILTGESDEAVAVLDEAILDLSVLA